LLHKIKAVAVYVDIVTIPTGMVRVWVAGKLCDAILTHGKHLSALEIKDL